MTDIPKFVIPKKKIEIASPTSVWDKNSLKNTNKFPMKQTTSNIQNTDINSPKVIEQKSSIEKSSPIIEHISKRKVKFPKSVSRTIEFNIDDIPQEIKKSNEPCTAFFSSKGCYNPSCKKSHEKKTGSKKEPKSILKKIQTIPSCFPRRKIEDDILTFLIGLWENELVHFDTLKNSLDKHVQQFITINYKDIRNLFEFYNNIAITNDAYVTLSKESKERKYSEEKEEEMIEEKKKSPLFDKMHPETKDSIYLTVKEKVEDEVNRAQIEDLGSWGSFEPKDQPKTRPKDQPRIEKKKKVLILGIGIKMLQNHQTKKKKKKRLWILEIGVIIFQIMNMLIFQKNQKYLLFQHSLIMSKVHLQKNLTDQDPEKLIQGIQPREVHQLIEIETVLEVHQPIEIFQEIHQIREIIEKIKQEIVWMEIVLKMIIEMKIKERTEEKEISTKKKIREPKLFNQNQFLQIHLQILQQHKCHLTHMILEEIGVKKEKKKNKKKKNKKVKSLLII